MLKSEKGFDNIFTDVLNIKGLPHVIACGSPWQLITVSSQFPCIFQYAEVQVVPFFVQVFHRFIRRIEKVIMFLTRLLQLGEPGLLCM